MSCAPYSYQRPCKFDGCEPPVVKKATTPCHEKDRQWGDLYEGVEYPLQWILSAVGSQDAWSIAPKADGDEYVRLEDEGASYPAYFTLTRVSGSSALPLQTGELVTVTIDNPADAVVRQLYWQKLELTQLTCFILSWVQDSTFANNAISGQFKLTFTKRCCDVQISLTPNVTELATTTVGNFVTDTTAVDTADAISVIHAIIWPNYAGLTAARQTLQINYAFGEWSWDVANLLTTTEQ